MRGRRQKQPLVYPSPEEASDQGALDVFDPEPVAGPATRCSAWTTLLLMPYMGRPHAHGRLRT